MAADHGIAAGTTAPAAGTATFLHAGPVDERGWLTEQQLVDAAAAGAIAGAAIVIGRHVIALG